MTFWNPPQPSRRRVSPDVVCYGAAVSACEKGQQWTHALQLLTERRAPPIGRERPPGGWPAWIFFWGKNRYFCVWSVDWKWKWSWFLDSWIIRWSALFLAEKKGKINKRYILNLLLNKNSETLNFSDKFLGFTGFGGHIFGLPKGIYHPVTEQRLFMFGLLHPWWGKT